MICGLAHHSHANSTVKLFWKLEKGVQPNGFSYVRVMLAFCCASLPEVGRR